MQIVKPLNHYIVCVPSQVTPNTVPLMDWYQITSKVGSLTGDIAASPYDLYGLAFPLLTVNEEAIAAATR